MSGIFDQIINYSPPLIVSGTVNYKGTWNASTNNPTLNNPPAASTKGDYYVVSTAGTQFGISFVMGDWIISNGTAWEKVDLTDAVSSVFGRTGAVVGVSTDYSAVGITNTAIGAANPSTGAFTTVAATSITNGLGAVGTPSYSFTGDLNTGMWSPAADTIAFSEGGAEVMRINSSGNVGIGTTSPVAKLDINGNAIFDSKTVTIGNLTSDSNERLRIYYDGTLARAKLNALSGVSLGFGTNGIENRVVLDTNGNLGIGTASPAAKLDVNGNVAVTGTLTVNAISGINALAAGTQLATFESSVNGAAVELITKGKNSVGTARQANIGINRFADDVLSISNGTTELLRLHLTTQAATFTGAFTTLSATGDVTASGGNILNTSGGTIPIRVSGATTGSSVARFANTGGDTFFGAEGNATNNLIIGCTAYDTIVRGPSGIAFSANNGTNMQMRLSSTGLAVTGALSATTSALVNRSGVTAPTSIATNAAQFVGATGESTNLEIDTFAATPFIYGVRRQGTPASPTATQSGNNLLAISGRGYGTTTTSGDGARILFQAAENFTDSAQGSRILLQATATGSTSIGTIATVDATGLAVTGALSSTGALAIGNTVAAAVAVASTHKVTIVIGGVTYYLLATNV